MCWKFIFYGFSKRNQWTEPMIQNEHLEKSMLLEKTIRPARLYWKKGYFKKHVRFFYSVIVLFNWKKFVQKSLFVFNLFYKCIAPLFQKRQQKILIAFETSSPCEQLPFRCLKENPTASKGGELVLNRKLLDKTSFFPCLVFKLSMQEIKAMILDDLFLKTSQFKMFSIDTVKKKQPGTHDWQLGWTCRVMTNA